MKRLTLLIIILCWTLPVMAQECLDCHEDSLNMEKFNKSVHGEMEISCTDCHGDFKVTDDGHDEPPLVSCYNCHEKSASELNHSVHTRSDKFEPLNCWDCHGSHDILADDKDMGREFRIAMNEICGDCHMNSKDRHFPDKQRQFVKLYNDSIHHRSIEKSGLVFSATCVDCHGSHLVESAAAADCSEHAITQWKLLPETCGKCHKGSLKNYLGGIHGQRFMEGNKDAPICTDCHEKHLVLNHYEKSSMTYPVNIPDNCLKCHSDPEYIEKYGFSPMKSTNYGDSFHGAALKLGDTSVATCVSCHGVHKILTMDDPESMVSKENLGDTCGNCHSDENPVDISSFGKIHAITAQQSHPISRWVALIYKLIIVGTLGFFGFYICIDLFRISRNRKKK